MSDPAVTPPLAPGQIEIWRKIVDVQQHLNDLERRIPNFALVVTGAFLGLGGYAIKDVGSIKLQARIEQGCEDLAMQRKAGVDHATEQRLLRVDRRSWRPRCRLWQP